MYKVSKKFNLFKLFKPKTYNNLEIDGNSSLETNYTSSILFTSKIHQFKNLPEPRNATEDNIVQYFTDNFKNLIIVFKCVINIILF